MGQLIFGTVAKKNNQNLATATKSFRTCDEKKTKGLK